MTKRKIRVPFIAASRAARRPRQAHTTLDATGAVLYRSHYSPRGNFVVIDVCDPRVSVSPPATHKVFEEFGVRLYYRCRDEVQ